jgi:hypothetical protein
MDLDLRMIFVFILHLLLGIDVLYLLSASYIYLLLCDELVLVNNDT